MSNWRPSISVWTSKSGAPFSPTSSTGFGIAGGLFLALAGAGAALMLAGNMFGLLPLAIGSIFLKDVVAWFVASEAEREAFSSRLAVARDLAARPGLATPPIPVTPALARGATIAFLGACAATMVLRGERQVVALITSLHLGGFSALCWRDVLRSRKKR